MAQVLPSDAERLLHGLRSRPAAVLEQSHRRAAAEDGRAYRHLRIAK
jgi:hypothetical protein